MNEVLKLAVAFTTGAVVTYFFIDFMSQSPVPTQNADNDTASSTMIDTETNSEETDTSAETEPVQNEPALPIAERETVTPTPDPAPTYTPPPVVSQYPTSGLVVFTGSRFIPDEVVIIEGGSITFRNDSESENMWVASNFHPHHAAYPETSPGDCAGSTFDQCGSVGPGGLWSFTFNKTGKWFYHEHNNPTANAGHIRVMSKEDYDETF